MLAGTLSRLGGRAISRRFSTNTNKFSQWDKPSDSFPFDARKKVKFTIGYTLFVTTGLGYPFLVVYYQSTK